VPGDALALGFTGATFDSPDVGTHKTVTVSGIAITGGADAADYALGNTTATAFADITPVTVLTPVITAADKVYDGTAAAVITSRALTGVLPGDAGGVSLVVGAAGFADKNAGTGKTVTATGLSLTGPAAGKYLLSSTTATTTASIAKATLTVTANNAARHDSDPNPAS